MIQVEAEVKIEKVLSSTVGSLIFNIISSTSFSRHVASSFFSKLNMMGWPSSSSNMLLMQLNLVCDASIADTSSIFTILNDWNRVDCRTTPDDCCFLFFFADDWTLAGEIGGAACFAEEFILNKVRKSMCRLKKNVRWLGGWGWTMNDEGWHEKWMVGMRLGLGSVMWWLFGSGLAARGHSPGSGCEDLTTDDRAQKLKIDDRVIDRTRTLNDQRVYYLSLLIARCRFLRAEVISYLVDG